MSGFGSLGAPGYRSTSTARSSLVVSLAGECGPRWLPSRVLAEPHLQKISDILLLTESFLLLRQPILITHHSQLILRHFRLQIFPLQRLLHLLITLQTDFFHLFRLVASHFRFNLF